MSPLGFLIRWHRNFRGVPLKILAAELGIPPKKLSAIETGRRRSLSEKDLERVCEFLSLSEEESATLHEVAQFSHPHVRIPDNVSPREYLLAHYFVRALGHLSENQINVIHKVLNQRASLREGGDMT